MQAPVSIYVSLILEERSSFFHVCVARLFFCLSGSCRCLLCAVRCGWAQGDHRIFLTAAEDVGEAGEIFLVHNANPLCGEGLLQIHIHIIGMVVGFQANIAAWRQQIFEIELADECILLIIYRTALISEITIEDKAVIQ